MLKRFSLYVVARKKELSLTFVVLGALAAAGFSAFSNLISTYSWLGYSLLAVVAVSAIFSKAFDTASNEALWKRRIFNLDDNTKLITGAILDEHGIYAIPNYDQRAALVILPTLKTLGINGVVDHCEGKAAPRGHHEHMILFCGPVHNTFSAQINEQLKSADSRYKGFFFSNTNKVKSDSAIEEVHWILSHKVFDDISLPFEGLPRDGASSDIGLIYVGPNPVNTNSWLIWIAGLGPIGTLGASRYLLSDSFTERAGMWLIDENRYFSTVIYYTYRSENPDDGIIEASIFNEGSLV